MGTLTRRVLSVILPFAQGISGRRIGGIRIRTPRPYATDDYYIVSLDNNEAVFLKEDKRGTVHVVDRDMRCCDCPAYHNRRKCRHLDALAALARTGKI